MSVSNPGVNYSAILPLSWRNAEQVTAAVLEQWMGGNITLLRAFETMDSISIEHHPELRINDAKALERLESKVDLALGLLTQLLAKDLPQPISCTLSASGIEWL